MMIKKYAETVGDITSTQDLLTFFHDENIQNIVHEMQMRDAPAAGVIDRSGQFIGMITEREIVRRLFGAAADVTEKMEMLNHEEKTRSTTAWDVMIVCPDCLHPSDTIETALEFMTTHGYRYMPVSPNRGRLDGIIDIQALHQHHQAKINNLMAHKDSLLSYFSYPELYGGAGGYLTETLD